MKRQSLVLLAVAFVAAGAAGCFSDPVSSLRNGPATLSVTSSSVFVLTGDSTSVTATLLDNAGNALAATGATWSTQDPTIAVVTNDTTKAIPGAAYTKGSIRGVAANGGLTNVTVTVRGITATVRVVVVPALIPSTDYSVTGTANADTVVIPAQNGPPPVPAQTIAYSAGDTLVINGTGFLNFDSTVSAYSSGPSGKANGFAVYHTPTSAHIVFTSGASGRVIVKGVNLATTSTSVDTVPVDSLLLADSMLLARARYRGAFSQTGDTVSLTATNGIHFLPSTVVKFGANAGVLFDTTGGGKVLATAGYTGPVTLQGVGLGAATLDAVTSTAQPTVTAAGFAFPGTVTTAGDTMTVTATGPITFDSTTRVKVGATSDSVIGFDATHLFVLASAASTGTVAVSKPKVGLAHVAALTTAASYTTTTATVPAASISQAGDTLTVTGNGALTLDAKTTVAFGATTPTVLSTGANSISVILGAASYTGVVTLKNAKVGIARIASLASSASYTVNQASFLGTLTVAGDTMTITAPANVNFDGQTGVSFGASAAYVVSSSATTLTVISPVTYPAGKVTVTKALIGAVRVPAMITPLATYTINAATLPAATVSQVGDTLTVTGNAALTVDGQATVSFGAAAPTVLNRGSNSVSVINGAASYTGPVTVKNAKVGLSRVASLAAAGPYTVNQAKFLGTLTVLGDTMTITAPAGMTFDAQTRALFGASGSINLGFTASTLKVLSPVTYGPGAVQVVNALLGTVRIPATLTPAATYSINGSAFPSANVSVGGGLLGDTITVTAPAGFKFDTATAHPSMVLAGNTAISTSDTAWILSRTPTQITAMAKRGGIAPIKVTNLIAGSVELPYLPTATPFTIDSINTVLPSTGFNGALGDDVAHAVTIPPSGDFVAYSTLNPQGSFDADYWTWTTTLPSAVSAEIDWFGSGNPYSSGLNSSAYTDDLDVILCSKGMACDESGDLFGFAGATTTQPQAGAFGGAPAGQYWLGVFAFTASYAEVYKLKLSVY